MSCSTCLHRKAPSSRGETARGGGWESARARGRVQESVEHISSSSDQGDACVRGHIGIARERRVGWSPSHATASSTFISAASSALFTVNGLHPHPRVRSMTWLIFASACAFERLLDHMRASLAQSGESSSSSGVMSTPGCGCIHTGAWLANTCLNRSWSSLRIAACTVRGLRCRAAACKLPGGGGGGGGATRPGGGGGGAGGNGVH